MPTEEFIETNFNSFNEKLIDNISEQLSKIFRPQTQNAENMEMTQDYIEAPIGAPSSVPTKPSTKSAQSTTILFDDSDEDVHMQSVE